MTALIVNLFGGPGCGKSTMASAVFHNLKKQRINCEYVHEYAKELAWEKRMGTLSNQVLILGQQFEMFRRCMDQVDVIITDTSLLNSAIYCHNYDLSYAAEIEALSIAMYNSMNNLPIYVNRTKPYIPIGRYQNEAGADKIAERTYNLLLDVLPYSFCEVTGDDDGINIVMSMIAGRMIFGNGGDSDG
jgi:hypothetical protein